MWKHSGLGILGRILQLRGVYCCQLFTPPRKFKCLPLKSDRNPIGNLEFGLGIVWKINFVNPKMMRKASSAIWVLRWNFSQQKFQFDMHVCRTRKLLSFWASSRSLKGFHWDGSLIFSNRHWWRYAETKSISLYKRKARMANVWILVVHQFYEKMFGSKMEGGSMWVVPRHLESLLHMFIGKPFILDEVLNSKILSKSLDGWLKEIRELDMIQSPGIPQISAYFFTTTT